MTGLKFCANISWLFPELPELSQRAQAAARAGFGAVEAAWLSDSDPEELRRVAEQTGLEVALINTPPGESTEGRTFKDNLWESRATIPGELITHFFLSSLVKAFFYL